MKVKIKQFGNTTEADVGLRTFWFKNKNGIKQKSSSSLNNDFYVKWLNAPSSTREKDKENDIFTFKIGITL